MDINPLLFETIKDTLEFTFIKPDLFSRWDFSAMIFFFIIVPGFKKKAYQNIVNALVV